MVVPWPPIHCLVCEQNRDSIEKKGGEWRERLKWDYLSGRVNHDISSVLNWTNKESTSAEGIVYDDRDPSVVGNFGDCLKIRNIVPVFSIFSNPLL